MAKRDQREFKPGERWAELEELKEALEDTV